MSDDRHSAENDVHLATIERLVAEAHERGYSLDALLTRTYDEGYAAGKASAVPPAPPCEVHVPGRDEPSPWCAACRMSGASVVPPGGESDDDLPTFPTPVCDHVADAPPHRHIPSEGGQHD